MAPQGNEYTSVVGRRVRQHREAAGLNQGQLAQLAGVSQPTISRIEQGDGVLDAMTALRLAAGLGVRVGALLSPAHMIDQMVTAARPGDSDSGMDDMIAAARAYLADYRRIARDA